ncbi:chorismate mutase [Kaistia algarum]|uniref:chorismate mutase n=1 Tax=Kaistia algarum TaxID=2083279 RepID=UPI000CE72285|nr:chorismate mutase [Kaistia algarum]MCX5514856.1 chorismate mutase [Kaistia algarum]PPE79980.1 chorismate mutase [Kaistia algarum]
MVRRPEDCHSKAEIRTEIDRLDRELVERLAERFAYVQRMAELKTDPDEALVPARVDEVLDRVAATASAAGFDPGLARELWAHLIDWNIAFEREAIARRLGAA